MHGGKAEDKEEDKEQEDEAKEEKTENFLCLFLFLPILLPLILCLTWEEAKKDGQRHRKENLAVNLFLMSLRRSEEFNY